MIYWYLATGDLQVALERASCADVDSHDLVEYITRVIVFDWTKIYRFK